MALKVGNNAVANAFVGASQVRRAYKGGTLVYQGWGPSSEQEFIQQTAAGGPAQLLKVYGKSVVWAQLVKNGDFSDGTTNWQGNNGTISATGGILTWTATNTLTYANLRQASTGFVNGHKYFVSFNIKGAQSNKLDFALGNAAGGGVSGSFDYGTDWTTIQAIISPLTATDFSLYIRPNAMAVSGAVAYFKGPIVIIDLTLLYGAGSEPASVAAFLADYPTYDPAYDAGSIQSNKTSQLRAERIPVINVWDEEWELGNINASGADSAASDRIRSKGYIATLPNTAYYFRLPFSANLRVAVYDTDKVCLGLIHDSATSGKALTLSASTRYIRFVFGNSLVPVTAYGNDICINVSDPAINGTYYPHWRGKLTLNIPTLTGKLNGEGASVVVFPDGMRGVGSIRDEAYSSTGIVRMGRVDLGTLTWTKPSSVFITEGILDAKQITGCPFVCPNFISTDNTSSASQPDKSAIFVMAAMTQGKLALKVKDSDYSSAADFKAAMAGVYLDYELATPVAYFLDTPLPTDLTCEQGDILQRVSDNNCPFVGEMRFGL